MISRGAAHVTLAAQSVGYLIHERDDSGVVHSVFAGACNFACSDGRLLTLAHAEAGNAPTTILLAKSRLPDLRALFHAEATIVCSDRMLRVSGVEVQFGSAAVWYPRARRDALAPAALAQRLRVAENYLARHRSGLGGVAGNAAHRAVKSLVHAVKRLDRDAAVVALQRVIGLGEGLTPAGDDFVIGLLAGLDALPMNEAQRSLRAALGAAVADFTYRTTDISAHSLRLASRGHYAETLDDLRDVLFCEHRARLVQPALERVLQIGATSGADTLAGLLAALETRLVNTIATEP